jgi:hypothetical protein
MNFLFFRKKNKWTDWPLAASASVIFLIGFGAGLFFYGERTAIAPDDKNSGLIEKKSAADDNGRSAETGGQEFETLVAQLDSPGKVAAYIADNFTVTENESQTALAPKELYSKRSGGPQDIAVFSAFVLDRHSYETGVLKYAWTENGSRRYRAVAVFRDGDTPKYLVAVPGKIELVAHGWSFKDLLKKEEARTGASIEEYAFFDPGETDLTADNWIKK